MKTLSSRIEWISFTFALLAASTCEAQSQPGSLDVTFNAAATLGQKGYSVVAQPDGRVIGLGAFGLMRFLRDGSLDPLFQPSPQGPATDVGVVVLQPDGRILVTGSFTNSAGAPLPGLMRLNPDGSIDPSFNLAANAYPSGRVLALYPDGKVVTGGFISGPGDAEHAGLFRLRPDGSLDSTFDLTGSEDSTDIYSVALAPDGKIYYGTRNSLARLNPNGSYDESFSVEPESGPFAAITLQPDGKVLVGQYSDGTGYRSLRRVNNDGTDDPDWMVPAIDGGDNVIQALLRQPDGKVVLGGDNLYGISGVWAAGLGRLLPDGALDPTFDSDSELHYYSVHDMAFAPDGRIYVAGTQYTRPDVEPAPGIWRLNNEASLQARLGIRLTAGEGITLELLGQPGASYRLEYRAQLPASGVWTSLTTLTLTGTSATWQDAGWSSATTRFYRAVSLP